MDNFLTAFLVGESFLLSFLLYFHPLTENAKANKWLGFFAFIMGTAFAGSYMEKIGAGESYPFIIKWINSFQFLSAPSLYISILYFVNPTTKFRIRYWLHFLPFLIFAVIENFIFWSDKSISTEVLFDIGETSFFVRDILPFQLSAYIFISYLTLVKHNKNIELIIAATQNINLNWLKQFLLILIFIIIFWINDAFEIFPVLVKLNQFVYPVSIFFLAFYAMKQAAVFPFEKNELAEISGIINQPDETPSSKIETRKIQRLSEAQAADLSVKLNNLMETDKIFLNNEITLATVAEKLEISIHDASYLINEVTGSNFYNFINRFRVEEAKKLLTSTKTDKLNMLGIAFESGFNSKTTFNTAFKKLVGLSPTEYAKQQKNQ